jgi:hypothetical protein
VAVLSFKLNYLALLMEVGVHRENRREGTLICDAAERCAIRWPLKDMPEGGFHEIDELFIGRVLGPAPLKVAYTLG